LDGVLASVAGEVPVMPIDHDQAGAQVAGEIEGEMSARNLLASGRGVMRASSRAGPVQEDRRCRGACLLDSESALLDQLQ
jgi:hypothetical protein